MLEELAHSNDPDLSLLDMMPLPNVWIGATITSQQEADRDIPKLMNVPACVNFLSMEHLLGPVDLKLMQYEDSDYKQPDGKIIANTRRRIIQWVIVGGESGRDQCKGAGVSFLFKQWGEWAARSSCYHQFTDGTSCKRWPSIRLRPQRARPSPCKRWR